MNTQELYTAIIIDDEPKLREVLNIKLSQFCPEIKVLDMAEDVTEAHSKITLLKPQLIFLDIAMPGESGFDLLDKFEDIEFEIIFVTGYNEYALDALKVSAVDYILKPVKTVDLQTAVAKAQKRIDSKSKVEKYDVLRHNLRNLGDQNSKITIPGTNAYEFVTVGNIVRCEGWQKYTKIFLKGGDVLISSYNIGMFKEMLESYNFFSTHKSHLINKKEIKRYLKDGTVVMSDDSQVPVARRRKDDFISQVVKFISVL